MEIERKKLKQKKRGDRRKEVSWKERENRSRQKSCRERNVRREQRKDCVRGAKTSKCNRNGIGICICVNSMVDF